jgi:hypothetical protein
MSKTSKYEQMKKSGQVRRGRRPAEMTDAERTKREEEKKAANRQRQEARRRALVVLEHQYKDEFNDLYRSELIRVKGESK